MIAIPNMVIITGSAKKVGKSFLCVTLIEEYSKTRNVTAIKTTSHFHGTTDTCNIIASNQGFSIYEDTLPGDKDSGRFVKAGAKKVYYIEAHKDFEKEAFWVIQKMLPQNEPIICESASWFHFCMPGILIFIADKTKLEKNAELLETANLIINSKNGLLESFDISSITYKNNIFSLTK